MPDLERNERDANFGEIVVFTHVRFGTYFGPLAVHTPGYRGSGSRYPGSEGALHTSYQSLHQFTIVGCCHCCASPSCGRSESSRGQRPSPGLRPGPARLPQLGRPRRPRLQALPGRSAQELSRVPQAELPGAEALLELAPQSSGPRLTKAHREQSVLRLLEGSEHHR